MTMEKCKECGNEISTKADACPKCGAKRPKRSGCGIVLIVCLLIVTIASAINATKDYNTAAAPASDNSSKSIGEFSPTSSNVTTTPVTPNDPGSQWSYHQSSDSMSKGYVYQAEVSSLNSVNFGFPYSGQQYARLILRTHPRYGKDVILQIERGQILCRSYSSCNILVRFDDGQPTTYSGIGPADNSSETVFIQNYQTFVQRMLKAKKVRISVDVYQEGAPVFEFNVENFSQDKYKPKK